MSASLADPVMSKTYRRPLIVLSLYQRILPHEVISQPRHFPGTWDTYVCFEAVPGRVGRSTYPSYGDLC